VQRYKYSWIQGQADVQILIFNSLILITYGIL